MDELAAALAGSFAVSPLPNNPNAPHPRFSQYKSRTTTMTQEVRRQRFLELQKQKRFDVSNYVRCIADDVWDDLEADEEDCAEKGGYGNDDDSMDVETVRLRKPGRYYQNQLMLSEWMLEVPENFVDDWLMVPCPVGRRNLVVASNGRTRSYSKSGFLVNNFHSALPGGSHVRGRSGMTILDCIYSEADRKYYVLDVMCWGHPVYDSETEFRFYWMQTKLQETPEVLETSKQNPCRFESLPNFNCSHDSLERVMNNTMNFELDGLLFYHKRAHYTFGTTPLVVWLKAYMMPEILGMSVPAQLLALAPSSYSDFGTHACKVRKQKEGEAAAAAAAASGSGGSETSSGHGGRQHRRRRGRGQGLRGGDDCGTDDTTASESMDSSTAELLYEDQEAVSDADEACIDGEGCEVQVVVDDMPICSPATR
jgi:snurportin-1